MRSSLARCAVLALGLLLVPTAAGAATPAPDTVDAVAVSGTVTDAVTGDPAAGVCVGIRPPGQNWWNEQTCTGADGTYEFDVAPGKYQVQFDDPTDDLGLQWWPKVHSPAEAEWLVVRRGTPVTDVDAELFAGATMTGRAIEGATGEPMDDACVTISTVGVEESIGSVQDPQGTWTVRGLPPAEVTAKVQRCSTWWRYTWAYDALTFEDATTFDLVAGAVTGIGRLELIAGATLRGVVSARATGERLAHIRVADWTQSRSGEVEPFAAYTNGQGKYTAVLPGRKRTTVASSASRTPSNQNSPSPSYSRNQTSTLVAGSP